MKKSYISEADYRTEKHKSMLKKAAKSDRIIKRFYGYKNHFSGKDMQKRGYMIEKRKRKLKEIKKIEKPKEISLNRPMVILRKRKID